MTTPSRTTLPARTDEMVATVSRWHAVIQDKLTAEGTPEWLEEVLCKFLREDQSLIETLELVKAADNGDWIADRALRRVDAEMRNAGIDPSVTLKAYGIKAALRGPITRGRGRIDNWRRDIGLCLLVYCAKQEFGLRHTRNRAQRRRNEHSASSLVALVVGRAYNLDEKRIENLYGSCLGAKVAFYVLRHFGLA
jgi:hypothetical protein